MAPRKIFDLSTVRSDYFFVKLRFSYLLFSLNRERKYAAASFARIIHIRANGAQENIRLVNGQIGLFFCQASLQLPSLQSQSGKEICCRIFLTHNSHSRQWRPGKYSTCQRSDRIIFLSSFASVTFSSVSIGKGNMLPHLSHA